jgi:hypothetical protein
LDVVKHRFSNFKGHGGQASEIGTITARDGETYRCHNNGMHPRFDLAFVIFLLDVRLPQFPYFLSDFLVPLDRTGMPSVEPALELFVND